MLLRQGWRAIFPSVHIGIENILREGERGRERETGGEVMMGYLEVSQR